MLKILIVDSVRLCAQILHTEIETDKCTHTYLRRKILFFSIRRFAFIWNTLTVVLGYTTYFIYMDCCYTLLHQQFQISTYYNMKSCSEYNSVYVKKEYVLVNLYPWPCHLYRNESRSETSSCLFFPRLVKIRSTK